jgi:hypothetical protein
MTKEITRFCTQLSFQSFWNVSKMRCLLVRVNANEKAKKSFYKSCNENEHFNMNAAGSLRYSIFVDFWLRKSFSAANVQSHAGINYWSGCGQKRDPKKL